MSRLTRVSTKKSSFIPTPAKFSPPPVLQPKAEKQPDAKLPEWKPGGGGATNPVQRLLNSKAMQAKLTIGKPGDAYQQEADRVSSQVMSMPAPADSSASIQRQLVDNHPQQIWQEAQSITPVVQTQIDSTVQMRELIQRADKIEGNQASRDLEKGSLQLDLARKIGSDNVRNLLNKNLDVYDIDRLSQLRGADGQILSPEALKNLTQNLERDALLDLIKQDVKIGAEQIRQIYIRKPFPKGNVANVEVQLEDGTSFGTGATSRAKSPAPQPQRRSQGGQFEPTDDSYSGRDMETDSEYKALSAIADTLDEAGYGTQVRGKIYLYTERSPCESCQGVIRQFKEKYPNIKVEIFSDYPYPYQP